MAEIQFGTRDRKKANREREPEREHEYADIAEKKHGVFTFGNSDHRCYYDTKYGLKQGPRAMNKKKILYLITKATWGDALWETHGFPIPSSTGKHMFSRPLSAHLPNAKFRA